MIFKQLFDQKSSTYTYIISSGKGRESLIIDPVIENTSEYLKILKDLDLKLVKVIEKLLLLINLKNTFQLLTIFVKNLNS